jgi:hypothetical protein
MVYTYDLWYNLPEAVQLMHKISVNASSSLEAIALARMIWDNLNAQGYYLQQRP